MDDVLFPYYLTTMPGRAILIFCGLFVFARVQQGYQFKLALVEQDTLKELSMKCLYTRIFPS